MPKHRKTSLQSQQAFEQRIGVHFAQSALLTRALTHCSYSAIHMERLEFLGDAILGSVIAEHLHDLFPDEAEGQLSRLRAGLVRKESLYKVAQSWNLEIYLHVGDGERSAQGVKSSSIVANAVEAVIGAVFKDAGWSGAQALVLNAWQPLLKNMDISDARDAKSHLQEYTQAKGWGLPEYKVCDLGVAHEPRFEAKCWVKGKLCGTGLGERKKLAELQAAKKAFLSLDCEVHA
ncbi:MAG: ribonuclease III [Proteobacteria bacterium]|nr:MAG: ribonuclease III [Pseudomonadota bacterium]